MENNVIMKWMQENNLLPNKDLYSGSKLTFEYIRVINRWVHRLILFIAEIALAVMIVLVTINVIMRYCFSSGISWIEEVPGLLVTLFAFLALAMGVRDHMHVSVNVIYNLFPKNGKVRKILLVFGDICVLGCGIFLLVYGCQYVDKLTRVTGTLPMTGLRTYWQYIPAPLAGFVITFDSILFLLRILDPEDILYSEKEIDYSEQVIHVEKHKKEVE